MGYALRVHGLFAHAVDTTANDSLNRAISANVLGFFAEIVTILLFACSTVRALAEVQTSKIKNKYFISLLSDLSKHKH